MPHLCQKLPRWWAPSDELHDHEDIGLQANIGALGFHRAQIGTGERAWLDHSQTLVHQQTQLKSPIIWYLNGLQIGSLNCSTVLHCNLMCGRLEVFETLSLRILLVRR